MNFVETEFRIKNFEHSLKQINDYHKALSNLSKPLAPPSLPNNANQGLKESIALQNKNLQIRTQYTQVQKTSLQADVERLRTTLSIVKNETSIYRQIVEQERIQKNLIKNDQERLRIQKNYLDNQAKQNRFGKPSNRQGSGFGSELISQAGFSVPTSPAAFAAAAVVGTGYGIKKTLDSYSEFESAQKLLAASAKESGLSTSILSQQARDFALRNRLSDTAATDNFARIATFAGAAHRGNKLNEFNKAFSDLASAKGIKPQELGEIAKQLNALTDEATDKLLGANPSAFYGEFAASIGKTADSLTDAEKRAAIFDAILRKGAIFTGEAEKKANTYAGQIDKMTASWENFKTKIGEKLSPTATGILKFITSAATGSPDFFEAPPTLGERQAEVNRKYVNDLPTLQEQQKAYLEAKQNPKANFQNYVLNRIPLNTDIFTPDYLSNVPLTEQLEKFRKERENSFNFYETDPEKRKELIDKVTEEAIKDSNDLVARFKDIAAKRPPLPVLLFEFQQFKQNASRLVDQKTKDEVAEVLADAINESVTRGFQKGLSKAGENFAQFQKLEKEIRTSTLLKPESREELLDTIERIRKGFKQTANDFKSLVADSITQTTQNPLVKYFIDAERAVEQAFEKYKVFGDKFAKQAANIVRVTEQSKINSEIFTQRQNALNFRQEAIKLSKISPTEIAGFQRRLSALEEGVNLISQSVNFRSAGRIDKFLSTASENGFDELKNIQIQAQFNDYKNIAGRISGIVEKFGDLGLYGQEAIARAKLSALPSQSELVELIRSGSSFSEQARNALSVRAGLNNVLANASDKRLEDVLKKVQLDNQLSNQAREQITLLQKYGAELPPKEQLDKFLNITANISELSADLVKARIGVLNQRASLEENQRREALALHKNIDKNVKGIFQKMANNKTKDPNPTKDELRQNFINGRQSYLPPVKELSPYEAIQKGLLLPNSPEGQALVGKNLKQVSEYAYDAISGTVGKMIKTSIFEQFEGENGRNRFTLLASNDYKESKIEKLTNQIGELEKALKHTTEKLGGDLATITIQNEAPDRARVTMRGKPSNVADRYR